TGATLKEDVLKIDEEENNPQIQLLLNAPLSKLSEMIQAKQLSVKQMLAVLIKNPFTWKDSYGKIQALMDSIDQQDPDSTKIRFEEDNDILSQLIMKHASAGLDLFHIQSNPKLYDWVEWFIARDAPIDEIDLSGTTALTQAIIAGRSMIVEL